MTTGDGYALAATGNLFDPAGGLHLDPGAPLAGYDPASGTNVALVVFTLQATSAMPAPGATLRDTATVVHVAASSGGANLAEATLPGQQAQTEVVGMAPAVAIALTGTGAAATPGNQLVLGETAAFQADITLPSGQSRGLHIGTVLPPGLAVVSETVAYATPGTTGLYVGETSTTGFDLGTLQAARPVTVRLNVVARATAALPAGTVQEVVSAADPAGTAARVSTSAAAGVSVIAPSLSLTVAGPATLQAGQVASYTVRLANAPGAAPAYGLRLQDALPAGLTLVPGSVQAAGTAAGAVTSTGATGEPMADVAELDGGETLAVTLKVQAAAVPAGTVLTQAARVDAASLPGGGVQYQLLPTLAATAATVVAATTSLTLSNPAPRVGDTVTVQAHAILPPGENPAVTLAITLPDGLLPVSGSVQATGAGAPAFSVSGGRVTAALGAVTAPPDGSAVSLTLQAQVGAVAVGTQLAWSGTVDTGYAVTPTPPVVVQVADTAPVLSGLPLDVTSLDSAASQPFTAVQLLDPDVGQVLTAQVALSNPGDGTLAGPGGTYDAATGRYVVSGPASTVQAALRELAFVPAPRALPYGATRTTGLEVQVLDGAGGEADGFTQVVAIGANTPPTLGGAVAGQTATTTLAALPFTRLTLADPDAGQQETLTVRVDPVRGSLGGSLGTWDLNSGTYVARGTVAALQADARALVFAPSAPGAATFALTLDDGAGGIAQDRTTMLTIQPSADTTALAQHFLQLPGANFLAYAGGQGTALSGEEYHGPVDYLRTQLIYDSPDPAVLVAGVDNAFVKSFSGILRDPGRGRAERGGCRAGVQLHRGRPGGRHLLPGRDGGGADLGHDPRFPSQGRGDLVWLPRRGVQLHLGGCGRRGRLHRTDHPCGPGGTGPGLGEPNIRRHDGGGHRPLGGVNGHDRSLRLPVDHGRLSFGVADPRRFERPAFAFGGQFLPVAGVC